MRRLTLKQRVQWWWLRNRDVAPIIVSATLMSLGMWVAMAITRDFVFVFATAVIGGAIALTDFSKK